MVTFTAQLALHGKSATGIEVPETVIEELDAGKRPPVVVSFRGHSYRTTVGVMGGRSLIPVSAEQRAAAGVSAGDSLQVTLRLDDAPREVAMPADLADALSENPAARRAFDALPPSGQKRHVLAITDAKTEETRQRRLAKILAELQP